MAWARKCDRCGKFFENRYNTYVELTTSSDEHRNVEFDCGVNNDLDLCSDCIESFKHWWANETKEASFKEYLDEQMEDPEFKKEYDEVVDNEKVVICEGFRNAIRDAIYKKGEAACTVSKTLGLPANCLTNIVLGYTKKTSYGRFRWICTALNINEYTEEHV